MNLIEKYFEEIKMAWAPLADGNNKIIPFCTPVSYSPRAVVIGTNHSDFIDGGGVAAEEIATEFANAIPTISTFIYHHHKYAKGLREVCLRAGILIEENWVGTNRCALQTGPNGINNLIRNNIFIGCQIHMDEILRNFIAEIKPKNIILAGKHAIGLYYPNNLNFEEILPKKIFVKNLNIELNLIPIPHPSRARFWGEAANRLRNNYIK